MITASQKIRAPFSTEELQAMDDVLEGLIGHVVRHTSSSTVAVKHFADDLTDMLVDIKVDLQNFKIKEQTNVQASSEGHNSSDTDWAGTGQSTETPVAQGVADHSEHERHIGQTDNL